ncbi:MAG: permease, partial [Acidobacteriota bacterium]|nr:permease [Acidobacteriota bacterium]
CSCGVIPVAASLRRHGASKGATTAFLLSTPQTGVDSIAVTYGLLGPFLAVVRPLAAFVTGVFGGALVQSFNDEDHAKSTAAGSASETNNCSSDCCDDDAVQRPKIVEALHYGLVILPRDIGRALVFGVVISGLIAAFVAPQALESYLGGGVWPMLVAMAIGIPLYVCATASTPIALGLIHAGLSPGAALVFLISGPATNTAALTTLWKVLGRRSAILYLVTVAVASLATGFAVDGLIGTGVLPESALVPAATAVRDVSAHSHHEGVASAGSWFETASAVVLLLVLVNALRPRPRQEENESMVAAREQVVELRVKGMRCNGCVQSLQRALAEISGVVEAEVRLEEGLARIRGNGFSNELLLEAVDSLGFTIES